MGSCQKPSGPYCLWRPCWYVWFTAPGHAEARSMLKLKHAEASMNTSGPTASELMSLSWINTEGHTHRCPCFGLPAEDMQIFTGCAFSWGSLLTWVTCATTWVHGDVWVYSSSYWSCGLCWCLWPVVRSCGLLWFVLLLRAMMVSVANVVAEDCVDVHHLYCHWRP